MSESSSYSQTLRAWCRRITFFGEWRGILFELYDIFPSL